MSFERRKEIRNRIISIIEAQIKLATEACSLLEEMISITNKEEKEFFTSSLEQVDLYQQLTGLEIAKERFEKYETADRQGQH